MIHLDPDSPVPLYDQIKAGLRGLVAKGLLRPGDEAPSIRALAVRLSVNPNTVARAYRELSGEGFFAGRRGEGSVIAAAAERRARSGFADLKGGLAESVRQARRGGLPWAEIDSVVREAKQEDP